MCPTAGSGEAGSHRCFLLIPSGSLAPLKKGAVSRPWGGWVTPKGAAERKRKWGGARLAAVAGVEATAWPVSGGGQAAGPALAAVPAVGLRPAGWPTPAGVCQRFLWVSTGLRAWGAGRAESGPGHARSARREPWSCGPRPRTVPRLLPPESPSPPAGNLASRLIIQDVWEQN